MRQEHRLELERLGVDYRREFRDVFMASFYRRTWYLNGELMAVGGVTGQMAETVGYAWMVISQEATKHPMTIIKGIRRHLDQLMLSKDELATTIIDGDDAAKRFAIFLGFHVEDEGDGAPAFDRDGRTRLYRHLEKADLKNRVQTKHGSVIAMGFH